MVKALNFGRMGNVMFQVACSVGYCVKYGLDFTVPEHTNNPIWNPVYFKNLVNPLWDDSKEQVEIKEKYFHYHELPFEESWRDKNIILNGYWQSANHFDFCRDEVLKAFNLPYNFNQKVCSIHARYGDYLTIEGKHIIIDEPYLVKAIEFISDKTGITRFKVFSDDLNLFKERHGNLYDFEYSENTNEVDDLVEASGCHSNIGSSSTFSWWINYLNRNQNKIIITQNRWFRENWREDTREVLTSDIIPPSWIKI